MFSFDDEDIGGILFGKYMRWMILFSIVLSQVRCFSEYISPLKWVI